MELLIYPRYEEMSAVAARQIADLINAKPDAVLGLATGSTPLGVYRELVRMHLEEGLDFSEVRTFNLDEYVGLGPQDRQSYHCFMHEHLFQHVNLTPRNTHIPSGTTRNYPAFCAWYERRIEDCGGIDLQILGIGGDGHIAFNEPGSSLASRTRLKTLARETIEDNARFFDRKEDVPIYAITMGVGTILEARHCLLLASGTSKAHPIAQAVEGPVTAMCTASALQLHPHVTVYLDEAAAGALVSHEHHRWIAANRPNAPRTDTWWQNTVDAVEYAGDTGVHQR